MRLSEEAPAKLNLALHVRARRADGYHEIETLFAFCAHGDRVEGEAADALTLSVEGPFAGGLADEGDNLVLRAARALGEAAGVRTGAALRLWKALPVASGLGGGSADAAAALRLLNRLWGLGWPRERLAELGGALGADVPACVWSRPALGRGRGELLEPVALAGAPALLVNPGVAVPTGPVFAAWDGVDRGALAGGDAVAAALAGRNDLEAPAIRIAPAVGDVLAALRALPGAGLARMSGSGATCFALFERAEAAEDGAEALGSSHPHWWVQPTGVAGA